MVDGVVVVADATTPKQVIRSTCKRLTAAGATIYGVVLNKVDTRQTASHKLDPYYGARERGPALERVYSDTDDNSMKA
jgi:Mrp family chromosome partitioning ATPase